ncbi:MAG TPA: cation transporter [Steroidobacteraceae bacterium]|nr:cation transporter [Steroidobacteraceae bacterium]
MLLDVRKMTCNHCVRSVTTAVHALDPDAKVEVDLAQGLVRVEGGRVDAEAAAKAIREDGYEVRVLQQ